MDDPIYENSFEEEPEDDNSNENQEVSEKEGNDLSTKWKICIKDEEFFGKIYRKNGLHMSLQFVQISTKEN